MASVTLFHSAYGLRPAVLADAERLRAAGHEVTPPTCTRGRSRRPRRRHGAQGLDRQRGAGAAARAAVEDAGPGHVYPGYSMGAAYPAHRREPARRRRRRAARPRRRAVDLDRWTLPAQAHVARGDEWVDDADAARAAGIEVFEYDGGHLFADPDLPDSDAPSAALVWERVLAFLAGPMRARGAASRERRWSGVAHDDRSQDQRPRRSSRATTAATTSAARGGDRGERDPARTREHHHPGHQHHRRPERVRAEDRAGGGRDALASATAQQRRGRRGRSPRRPRRPARPRGRRARSSGRRQQPLARRRAAPPGRPVRRPSARPALVAPGLPEPTDRRSMPRARGEQRAGDTSRAGSRGGGHARRITGARPPRPAAPVRRGRRRPPRPRTRAGPQARQPLAQPLGQGAAPARRGEVVDRDVDRGRRPPRCDRQLLQPGQRLARGCAPSPAGRSARRRRAAAASPRGPCRARAAAAPMRPPRRRCSRVST